MIDDDDDDEKEEIDDVIPKQCLAAEDSGRLSLRNLSHHHCWSESDDWL